MCGVAQGPRTLFLDNFLFADHPGVVQPQPTVPHFMSNPSHAIWLDICPQPTACLNREICDIAIARISAETSMVHPREGHTPDAHGQDLVGKRFI